MLPSAPAWSPSAAGTCPSNTPASPPSTWPCAPRPASSTSATWARSRLPARTRSRRSSTSRRNDASRLAGRPDRSTRRLTTPEGTFVDDVLVYRFGPTHFLLVVNAANIEKDFAWITARTKEAVPDVAAVNTSDRYALIAIQGPAARGVLQTLTGDRPAGDQVLLVRARRDRRRPRHGVAHRLHRRRRLRGVRAAGDGAERVWDALLAGRQARRPDPGRPRRARHAAPRSGDAPARQRHRRDHDGRRGRPRLDRRLEEGRVPRPRRAARSRRPTASRKKLVGFEMVERAIGRHGYPVLHNGQQVGVVTSGTQTPFLKKAIGMAYVPPALAAPGHRDRDRHPRPPGQGGGRAAAVLQAREEGLGAEP